MVGYEDCVRLNLEPPMHVVDPVTVTLFVIFRDQPVYAQLPKDLQAAMTVTTSDRLLIPRWSSMFLKCTMLKMLVYCRA